MALNRAEIVELDRRHVWHPYTQHDEWVTQDPLVIASAQGIWLTDEDGRRWMDGSGSWWVSNLGHGYPRVREALHAQLDKASHVMFGGATHAPAATLAARLAAVAPPGLSRTFFSDNGSTAVEVAIRVAYESWQQRGETERRRFVTLEGAYHGDTLGTVSLGSIAAFRHRLHGLLFDVLSIPAGDGAVGTAWELEMVGALEELLAARGDEVAAVVVEPLILGASGMRMYSVATLRRMYELAKAAGALFIADEVFVGMGRTGTLFACEQAGITPDLLCLSKGLTAGSLPFAVTLATEELFDAFRGERPRMFHYGHSYCGNPLGCAAAIATLDAFAEDGILEQSALRAAQMRSRTAPWNQWAGVAEVRQTGLVLAVQLSAGSDYADPIGWRVAKAAAARELLIRPLGNVVYLVPALTLSEPELDDMLERFGSAIRSTL
jgi:adenosylmethionine-8-amino-7-oxononanoate aminotransferase